MIDESELTKIDEGVDEALREALREHARLRPGDVHSTLDGSILTSDGSLLLQGEIFVSSAQAEKAKEFGWIEIGRSDGMVRMSRPARKSPASSDLVKLGEQSDTTHMVSFVLANTQLGTFIVNRFDFQQYEGLTIGVGAQLLNTGSYDRPDLELCANLLNLRREHHGDGVRMIDVGANIGVYTVVMARHMAGWGEVHAYEPQEFSFCALAGNVALNNCLNAHVHRAAVGDPNKPGPHSWIRVPRLDQRQFAAFGSLPLRREDLIVPIGQEPDYRSNDYVPLLRLNAEMLGERIDLVKIDAEGMELDVISGLGTARPVIIAEWLHVGVPALRAALESLGYRVLERRIDVVAVHESDPIMQSIEELRS